MQENDAVSFTKPKVIILDVYETLLDMSDVERKVNNLLDSTKGYMLWFELFVQYLFVDNCTGKFNNFVSIAKATMLMTARKMGRTVKEDDIDFVLELLKHLPVHEQVQEGLSELNDLGYRIAALTNSPEAVVYERMEPTGLISYFEHVLSAEKIKKYKPCLEVYEWAVKKMGVAPREAMLVSAHGWDLAGAANAGLQTAYMKQNRQMLYPLAPSPDLVCINLKDLAAKLSAVADKEQVA